MRIIRIMICEQENEKVLSSYLSAYHCIMSMPLLISINLTRLMEHMCQQQ